MNLITKLTEKLKVVGYKLSDVAQAMLNKIHTFGNSKVAKTFKTLTLCGVMVFSIATMSACNNTPTVDPGTSTVQPGGNENLKQYSQILQTVLTDSYYTKLTDEYKQVVGGVTVDSNKITANPYGFLKQEGCDINSILNHSTECTSVIYTKADKPKELIISTKVGDDYNGTPYYICYTLNYTLTDKELNDLNLLHQKRYIQAPLFIQELTYQKQPTTYTKTKITKTAYNEITNTINSSNKLTTKLGGNAVVDFLGFDKKTSKLFINVRNPLTLNNSNMIYTNHLLGNATLFSEYETLSTINDEIYSLPTKGIYILDFNDFLAQFGNITYYNSTNTSVYINDELKK